MAKRNKRLLPKIEGGKRLGLMVRWWYRIDHLCFDVVMGHAPGCDMQGAMTVPTITQKPTLNYRKTVFVGHKMNFKLLLSAYNTTTSINFVIMIDYCKNEFQTVKRKWGNFLLIIPFFHMIGAL